MRSLAIVAVLATAASADTTPVSALATKARIEHHPKSRVKITASSKESSNGIAVAAPACIVGFNNGLLEHWSSGNDDLEGDRRGVDGPGNGASVGIERLVIDQDADRAELERTLLDPLGPSVLDPLERGHIPLHRVATLDDHHAVYAYRFKSTVFVIAETTGFANVRWDSVHEVVGHGDGCSYSITQVRILPGSSQAAQISAPPYLIDASVTQTSRDPEPILAVTARKR